MKKTKDLPMAVIISRISNMFKNLLTFNNKVYKSTTRNLDITINIELLNLGREIKAKNIKGIIILKNYISERNRSSFISNIIENIFNKFFFIEGEELELEFCLMDKQNYIFKIEIERFSYVNKILLIEKCILYSFNKEYKQISTPISCVLELFESMNIYLSDIHLNNISIFDLIKILNYNILLIEAISSGSGDEVKQILIQIPSLEGKFRENVFVKLNKFYTDFTLPNNLSTLGALKCEYVLLKMKHLELLVTDLDMKLNFFLIFFNREIKREVLNYIFIKDEGFKIKVNNCIKYNTLRLSSAGKGYVDKQEYDKDTADKLGQKNNFREKYIIGNINKLNIYLTDQFILVILELIIIISNLIGGITFDEFDFDDLKSYLNSENKNSIKERLAKLNIENMSREFSSSEKEEINRDIHLGLYFSVVYVFYLINNSKDCKIRRNNETLKLSHLFDSAIVTKEFAPHGLLFLKSATPSAFFRLFFIELNYTKHKGIIKIELTDINLVKEIILLLIYSIKRYSVLNCYEEEFAKINRYLKVPLKSSVSFLNLNNILISVPKLCLLNFNGDFMRIDFTDALFGNYKSLSVSSNVDNSKGGIDNSTNQAVHDNLPQDLKSYSLLWDMQNKDINSILGSIRGSINTNILKKLLKIFNSNFINKFIKILETAPLKKSFTLFMNYKNYTEYSRKVIRIRNTSILSLNINLKGLPYPLRLDINSIELYENIKDFLLLKISYKKSFIDFIDNKIVGTKIDYSLLKKLPFLYSLYNKLNKKNSIKENIKISFKDLMELYMKVKSSVFNNIDILNEYRIREMSTNEIEKFLKRKLSFNGFKLNIMNLLVNLKEKEIEIKQWVSLNLIFNEQTERIELKGGCVISSYKLNKLLKIYNNIIHTTTDTSSDNQITGEVLTNLFFVDFKFILFLDTFYRFNLKYKDTAIISLEENCNELNYFYYILKPLKINNKEVNSLLDLFLSRNYTHIELNIERLVFNIKINNKSKLVEFINHKLNKQIRFNYTPNLLINNQKVKKYGLETSKSLNYKFDSRNLDIRNSSEKIEMALLKDIVISNNTIYEIKLVKENKEKILKAGINTMKYVNQFQIGNQVIKIKDLKGELVILISININNMLKYFKAYITKTEQISMNISPCISIKNEVFTGCVLLPTIKSNLPIQTSQQPSSINMKEIKGGCLVCGFKNECKKYLKILIKDQTINLNYSETLDLYDNYSYYLSAETEYPPCFKLVPKNDTTKRIGLFLNETNRNKLNTFSIKQEEDQNNIYTFTYKTLIATNIFSAQLPCKKEHTKNYIKPLITINKQILKDSYLSYNSVNTLNEEEDVNHNVFNIKINHSEKHKLKLKSTKTHFLSLIKGSTYLEIKPIFINNNVVIIIKVSCECEKAAYLRKYLIKDTQDYLKYLNSFDLEFFNCRRVKLLIDKVNVNVFSFNYSKFYEAEGIYEEYFYRNVNVKEVDLCPIPFIYEDVLNELYLNIDPDTCAVNPPIGVFGVRNGDKRDNKGNVFDYLFKDTGNNTMELHTVELQAKEVENKKELENTEILFEKLLNTKHIFIEESYKVELSKSIIRFYGILGNKDKILTLDYKTFQVDNPLMSGVLLKGDEGFLCVQIINKYEITPSQKKPKEIKYRQMINDVIIYPNSLIIYLGALSSAAGELPNIDNLNLIILTPLKIIAKLALATIPIDLKATKDSKGKDLKLIFPSITLMNSNLLIINKYLNKCLMNSLGNNILKNIPGISAGAIGKVFGKVGKGVLFNIKSLINKNENTTIRNFGFDILMLNDEDETIISVPKREFMFKYLQTYYDFYREYQKIITKLSTPLTFDYSLIKIERQNRFAQKLLNDNSLEEKIRRFDFPVFAVSKYCEPKILYACLIACEMDYSQIEYLLNPYKNPIKGNKLCQLINNLKSNPQKIVLTDATEKIIKFYLILNTMILTSNVSIIYKTKKRESYLILCKYFIYVYCFGLIKFKDIEVVNGTIIVKGKYILIPEKFCYHDFNGKV